MHRGRPVLARLPAIAGPWSDQPSSGRGATGPATMGQIPSKEAPMPGKPEPPSRDHATASGGRARSVAGRASGRRPAVIAGLLIVVACVLIPSGAALGARPPAAPPANDTRSKAVALTKLPATVVGTTTAATRETTDPRCGAPMVGTVWYAFSRSRPGT